MKIKKQEFQFILNELADFVEFAERQEKDGLTDGACDPRINIVRAKRILDKYTPGWSEEVFLDAV